MCYFTSVYNVLLLNFSICKYLFSGEIVVCCNHVLDFIDQFIGQMNSRRVKFVFRVDASQTLTELSGGVCLCVDQDSRHLI